LEVKLFIVFSKASLTSVLDLISKPVGLMNNMNKTKRNVT